MDDATTASNNMYNSTICEESVHVAIMAGTIFVRGMRNGFVSIFALYTCSRYMFLRLGLEDDIRYRKSGSQCLLISLKSGGFTPDSMPSEAKYHTIQPSHITALKTIL